MAWSIRNYNAFIRAASREYELNLNQARQMYRNMGARMERPLFARDLERHPRISRQEAQRAPRSEAARRAGITWKQSRERATAPARPEKQVSKQGRPEGFPAPVSMPDEGSGFADFPSAPSLTTIHDAEEWLDFWEDDYEDAEYEQWEGTPDYEED